MIVDPFFRGGDPRRHVQCDFCKVEAIGLDDAALSELGWSVDEPGMWFSFRADYCALCSEERSRHSD